MGRPGSALIVAPHPDDEVIGAAALIRELVRRRTRMRVVVVSDGAASHASSVAWPRRRLVAARRAESRRALRRLGVAAGAVRFLDLPDGALDPVACRRGLAVEAARRPCPRLIVGPAADDAHPDHRAVAAALAAIRIPATRLAYRVWPPGARHRGRTMTLPVSAAAKRSLIRTYRTQLGLIGDDPAGFAIARHELDAFARPLECFSVLR